MRKVITFSMALFVLLGGAKATTFTSVQNGAWNNPSTWSPNGIPQVNSWPGDRVIIGHEITYSGHLTYGTDAYLTIMGGGSLAISGNFNVSSQGNLMVQANGKLSCNNFTYTGQGVGSFSSAGTLEAVKLTILNHSNAFTLSGNTNIGTLKTNNGGGLTLNRGTFTATEMDLMGGGNLKNNGAAISTANIMALKQGFIIELDGDGTIAAETVDLKGGSKIVGTGTGGVLTYTNISMQNGTKVICANNLCEYDPNGGVSGNTPPSPIDLETGSQVVLPVELTVFAGKEHNGNILLYWTTAQEINNDYFELQYSTNGRSFQVIDKIAGAGFSTTPINYQSEDHQAESGVNYYRLRQVDFDESEHFSAVITVTLSDQQVSQLVRLWPNPVTTKIHLERSSETAQPFVQLITTNGQIMPIQVAWNGTFGEINFLNTLPSGLYFLKFEGETHRVMVEG